jgi:DNA-3-methyladenine glycosylase I
MRSATIKRCSWVSVDDPLMLQYHDREWGVPVHDDRKHFEFLVLEGAQAGLSWTIVLKKREGYRRAFDGFDPEKVARFSARRIKTLALDFVSVAQPLVKMPAFTAIATTQSAHVRFGNS